MKRQLQGEHDSNGCEIKKHERTNQIRISEWKNETKQEHNIKSKKRNDKGKKR